MSEHLPAIYEYLKRCRRATPPGPGIESSIDWLKKQVEDQRATEPPQMIELVLVEEGAGQWLVIQNEKEILVTHRGNAFTTIASIMSEQLECRLCLYDFCLSVDALRKTKRRVVDRLNSCGADLMAGYIDRNLKIHNSKTITVTTEPGVFFMVNRLNPEI